MSELDNIIAQLERQRTAIDNALQALQGVAGQGVPTKKRPGRPKTVATKKKRGLTEAGRRALAENMRKMWAAKRTAGHAKRATKKRVLKKAA